MKKVALDRSQLLGFRIEGEATLGAKAGAKAGAKIGTKIGQKAGRKAR